MNRAALVRLVLRSYPAKARTATDQEIAATVLDACDGSSSELVLQLGSLLRGGLASRMRVAACQPLRRLFAEGAGAGAMLLLAWVLAGMVHSQPPDWLHGLWPIDLMLAPALWALGFRRIAGLIALLALGTHGLAIGWTLPDRAGIGWINPYGIAVMLTGSVMLLAVPNRTRPTLTGRIWGLALLVLSSLMYVEVGHFEPLLLFPLGLCGALALAALPFAPELTVGLGAFCLAYALQSSFPIYPIKPHIFVTAFASTSWSTRVVLQWFAFPIALLLIAGARYRARASA